MSVNKITFHTLRVLFGLVFIFSGLLKLFPIEPFEVLMTDIGIAGWEAAPFVSRILISFEIALGMLVIINLYPKSTLKISIITLFIFNFYLLYTSYYRKDITDCGCFGNYLELTVWQSFFKNTFLILWAFILFRYSYIELKRFRILSGSLIIIASLALPMIINPPDAFFTFDINKKNTGKVFDTKNFGLQEFNDGYHSIVKGKVVLAFFSTKCRYCKYAAMKLSIIHREQNEKIPLYFVLMDISDKNIVSDFKTFTKSQNIPYKLLKQENFLMISGHSLPAIFFLEDGIIKKKTGFRTLKPDEVIEFLELKKN